MPPLPSPLLPPGSVSGEVITQAVTTDEDAIRTFLDSYKRKSGHTVRSYEKELKRYLLWLRATYGMHPSLIPQAVEQDANSYIDFLAKPRTFDAKFLAANGWKHQPFRKPLAEESMRHAIVALNKMYEAFRRFRSLNNQPYCLFNPFTMAHDAHRTPPNLDDIEEALSVGELEAVFSAVESLPRESATNIKHYHRARWVMHLLYWALLRREEAVTIKMGSFQPTTDGWVLKLIGKGRIAAKILVPNTLLEELKVYRTSLGLPPLPSAGEDRPAILSVRSNTKGITDQALYLLCKELFSRAADMLAVTDEAGAQRLRMATPHWMRHTGISHYLEAGADPRYVQAQARHSSLKVTATYDHKEQRAWRANLERLG